MNVFGINDSGDSKKIVYVQIFYDFPSYIPKSFQVETIILEYMVFA